MSLGAPEPRAGRWPGDDAGFTLMEVLATMAVATIVLLAILQSADVFARTTGRAEALVDSQDTERTTLRVMVVELRQARSAGAAGTSPIVVVGATRVSQRDLMVASYLPGSGASQGWVRYCVSTDGRSLYVARRNLTSTPTALPPCGTNGDGWQTRPLVIDRLRNPNVFSYSTDPTSADAACLIGAPKSSACLPLPADVRGVGIRLAVADRPSDGRARTALEGAVSLRNISPS